MEVSEVKMSGWTRLDERFWIWRSLESSHQLHSPAISGENAVREYIVIPLSRIIKLNLKLNDLAVSLYWVFRM